jgi:hypothetical protein
MSSPVRINNDWAEALGAGDNEDYDKLQLLSVIGPQQFKVPSLKTADYRN